MFKSNSYRYLIFIDDDLFCKHDQNFQNYGESIRLHRRLTSAHDSSIDLYFSQVNTHGEIFEKLSFKFKSSNLLGKLNLQSYYIWYPN